jgi:acetylornithine deacetylase/succinyl-diaminopimelate desuccinylase-like protein
VNDLERAMNRAEETKDEALETLFRLVAQPSISTRGEGMKESVEMLRAVMEDAGIKTRVLETKGNPAIFGEVGDVPDAPTVLFYGHYDVQPPEPLELWDSDPFEPEVRDGRIFGRGVADNKGQHLCHILAIKAWKEAVGELPVNAKLLIEGDEETGSPHLADLVSENKNLLAADFVYTSDGGIHASGSPTICFGARGLLYVEVEINGANGDAHSGNKGGVLPQPAWEMVELLASLRDSDGKANFPGFRDDVRESTPEEEAMLRDIPFDRNGFLEEHGLDEPLFEDGAEHHRRLAFEPTFNIAGLSSGYSGPGSKTIIPAKAVAKIDFRLVPEQTPEKVFEAFTAAVKERNPNAEVRELGGVPPSRTDPSSPMSRVVADTVKKGWNSEPINIPSLGGTLPDYVFTRILGVPSFIVPYANHDEKNHAPNENMKVECFYAGVRTTLSLIEGLGRRGRER